jgi:ADP-ribosylation factor-like protein 8
VDVLTQSVLVANPTMLNSELATTPLLVLANKIDLEPHISEPELIRELNLDYIVDNPWLVIPISALRLVNIDQVIQWLMKQSGKG